MFRSVAKWLLLAGIVIALMWVSLIGGTGGCSGESQARTEGGRIIVNYWEKWTGFERDAMLAIVEAFNSSQSRYEVQMLTVSEINQKLMLATAGGNPPDVAGLWSHTLPVYAEKGALTPLGRYLEQAGIDRSRYIDAFWELCRHRGFTWALPSTPASVALHWNKSMFRRAGLDPEQPPRTIAELDRMADRLTVVEVYRNGNSMQVRYDELTEKERDAKDFTIIELGHSPAEPGWWRSMWGYWFGGSLWDGERQITASSPGNVAAYQWYQGYAEKYGVNNLRRFGATFGNFSSPQNPFLSGRVAMVLQGVWMYNFIDKYAPQLEWAAAPFPAINGEQRPNVTIVECDVLVIPYGARQPDGAFEFIHFVNSQPAMEQLCLGQRKFSPLRDVSDRFVAMHPNPYVDVFIKLAASPNARYAPRLSVWNEYDIEMQVAIDRLFALDATPREALVDAERRIQWKFDRIMRRWDLIREQRLKEWSQR
jgi:ABC-type glycerol-3-phosphate transport system substrate-binding protein